MNTPLSFNLWNYVNGNPVNLTDPTGNVPDLFCRTRGDRLATAEYYVTNSHAGHIITDEMNTYTAAGIAVQCSGLLGDSNATEYDGEGIGQISKKQASTPYGDEVEDDNGDFRGDGILCYIVYKTIGNKKDVPCSVCKTYDEMVKEYGKGNFKEEAVHSNINPTWAAELMRRRIKLVVDACKGNKVNCTLEDKFIIAALAQNGPGFSLRTLTKDVLIPKFLVNKEIQWQSWYTQIPNSSKTKKEYPRQLREFYMFITMLHNDNYWLPEDLDLNDPDILWLKSQ